ncbi:hypothetical protein PG995_004384 [Apiospora arundinis]
MARIQSYDSLVHEPPEQAVRIRISSDNSTVYAAVPRNRGSRVQFSGPMQRMRCAVMMTPLDLLVFDQKLPPGIFLKDILNPRPASGPCTPLSTIALHIDHVDGYSVNTILCSLDSDELSHIILITDSPCLTELVRGARSGSWGLRTLPDEEVSTRDPETYKKGLSVMSRLTQGRRGLNHEFAIDWEDRGKPDITVDPSQEVGSGDE